MSWITVLVDDRLAARESADFRAEPKLHPTAGMFLARCTPASFVCGATPATMFPSVPRNMSKALPLLVLGTVVVSIPAFAFPDDRATPTPATPAQATLTQGTENPPRIERITTAVPWPRGVRYVDGRLFALARGVHRSAGGPQDTIEDLAGSIFLIDPTVSEPAVTGRPVGEAVRKNASVFAAANAPPFHVWDRRMPATLDTLTDRPYCMLVYDEPSQNLFVCGYSGIDLPGKRMFRKNATDSIHRYDLRSEKWYVVEAHDPTVVPEDALGQDVDSRYYPHHDPETNPPPHGLVNGPCGAVVAGDFLYVGAKDNTALAQYDLREIRKNPDAPPPPARCVFESSHGEVHLDVRGHGKMWINGTCALTTRDDWLYVSFRTTSQLLRLRLDEDGSVREPLEVEYIAQFARYDSEKRGGSANIYDLEFDAAGQLYVSPGYDGAIYRFTPDPGRVYDSTRVDYEPFVDLEELVGAKKSGNICFDDEGHLYVCCGQDLTPDEDTRGVIYRVRVD